MNVSLRTIGLCASLAAAAAAAAAGAATPFRFEELAKTKRIESFSLSPDGRLVAFSLATADLEENRMRSGVWLVPSSGGAPRALTSGRARDTDPKFSPDGALLAFLSDRDGGTQIWVLDLAGGEPRKATSFPTEINDYKWSMDGKAFLATSDVFPDCHDVACLERRLAERRQARTKARVAERLLFRHWNNWKEGMRSHIWKIPSAGPPEGKPAKDLTPGDRDAPVFAVGGGADYDLSPDGRSIVFAAKAGADEALSTNADLFVVATDRSGDATNLTSGNSGFDGSPKVSPDGKWIAYRAQTRSGFESDRFRLRLLDRAKGTSRTLTEGFDNWVDEIAWASNSKFLYFVSHVAARSAVYRVDLAGSAPVEIWRGGGAADVKVSPDGTRLFFSHSTLSRAAEIWSLGVDGKDVRAVTHVNDALFAEHPQGSVSERWTTSADGRKLQAWLVQPPGFDPAKKYPAVFFIHGGPQGAWADSWSYRWNPQVWAAYGYVVYAANPRGSTGWGQQFVDEISRDWGGKAYDDLMRQADDLASLPYVDRDRIGAAGASYGGYMIDWMAGHTNRFRCLVSHDGTYDTNSASIETEELWFPYWEFGGWPWDSPLYEKWNPMRSSDKFQTPTLVVTSERDFRVPFGQGLQFFTALQIRKVPSKLLTFPDEGHWVLKPGNSRLWHATIMDWLHRWLGGAAPDPKALETAYSVTK